MDERAVALRVALGQGAAGPDRRPGDVERALAPADGDLLGRDADVDEASAEEHRVEQPEDGVAVDARGHVEPVDDDGAVEGARVGRPPDHDPGLEGCGLVRLDGPDAVPGQLADRAVGPSVTLEEELLLEVVVLLAQHGRHAVGTGSRDRAGDLDPLLRVPHVVPLGRGPAVPDGQ